MDLNANSNHEVFCILLCFVKLLSVLHLQAPYQ